MTSTTAMNPQHRAAGPEERPASWPSADSPSSEARPVLDVIMTALVFALFGAALTVAALLSFFEHDETLETRLYVSGFLGGGAGAALGVWATAVVARRSNQLAGLWTAATAAALALALTAPRLLTAAPQTPGTVAPKVGTAIGLYVLLLVLLAAWFAIQTVSDDRVRRLGAWLSQRACALICIASIAVAAITVMPLTTQTYTRFAVALGLGLPLAALSLMEGRSSRRGARALRWGLSLAWVGLIFFCVMLVNDLGPGEIHHFNFYMGPINDAMHGRTLLVDTFPQYGVMSTYLLSVLFQLVPLQYGWFWLTLMFLIAAQFAVHFLILRLAMGTVVLPAVVSLASIAVTAPFTTITPTGNSPLRYGLPDLLILLALADGRAKRPWARRAIAAAALLIVAVASVWSFEMALYTVTTALGMAVLRELLVEVPTRRQRALGITRSVGAVVGTVVAAHALFAVVTRLVGGAWPDWSGYLQYIGLYADGGDFPLGLVEAWSPGFLYGALGGGSLIVITVIALTSAARRQASKAAPGLVLALGGAAIFTSVLLSYFVARSSPAFMIHLITPAPFLLLGLWAAFGQRLHRARVESSAWIVAAVSVIAMLTVASNWNNLRNLYNHSAFGVMVHGKPAVDTLGIDDNVAVTHPQLRDQLEFLASDRYFDKRLSAAEQLVERRVTGDDRLVVLLTLESTTELLLHLDRVNGVRVANPIEDNLLLEHSLERVRGDVDSLGRGDYVLVESNPAVLSLPLQQQIWQRIDKRYETSVVDSTAEGIDLLRIIGRADAEDASPL